MRLLRLAAPLFAVAAALAAPLAAAAEAGAAEPYVLDADVGYLAGSAGGPLNRFDVYRPVDPVARRAPVVVYVHGGGWSTGDKRNKIADKARLFTSAGYVFVSVNYRLSPNPPEPGNPGRIRFPVHPIDVAAALGAIGERAGRWGGDGERIAVIGHSAGAHLAALVSTRPDFVRNRGLDPLAIRGFVALDTESYDIASRADPNQPDPPRIRALQAVWNAIATPAENAAEDAWEQASPISHADRRDPPALLVTQSAVPDRIAAAEQMAAALGLDPSRSVLGVPLNHRGINEALGSPADDTGETERVLAFVEDSFAIDGAPRVELTKQPKRKLRTRKARARIGFRFRSADVRATYRCRVDGRKWRTCSSPAKYRLEPGRHRFRVRAKTRDGLGPVESARLRIVRR